MTDKRNQGEGNREADARYRERATQFAESGAVDEAAEAAESAIDGGEGPALREAERRGKEPARGLDQSFDDGDLDPGDSEGLDWDQVRQAIRFGHEAATRFPELSAFADLEAELERDWEERGHIMTWQFARPHVERGWEQGRKDMQPIELSQ